MTTPRPLRVHLVHQSFADYVGGLIDGLVDPRRVVADLEGAEGGLVRGVELRVTTLLSGSSPHVQLRPGPVEHRTVSLPRARDPRALPKALQTVRQVLSEPCDVLHWQAAGSPWVDFAFSVLMGERPTVVTVHDMQPHPGDRNMLPGTFRAIHRVARRADRVVVHAPHIAEQGRQAGIASDRISLLPHGELASRYLPPDQLPLPAGDEPTILFFGRAQGYKGLDVLAKAMPMVVERVPKAKLVVAGSGYMLDEIFPATGSIPDWAEVHRGSVGDAEVVELFGRAAVVALPYREASQSGVAALAAGFGRAVVASAVPGLVDIVEDGVTGRLVEPESVDALASSLVEVLDSPSEADRLGRGAYSAAEGRLSWASISAGTLDVYHRAVQAHHTRAGGSGSNAGGIAKRARPSE